MRILAIRGENLASLREFDVDLEALDEVGGVFAITGPTGAGKSTLLDALCLALYDSTPRLNGRSGVQIGRAGDEANHLGDTDVRTILRRGAGSGYAEVDFVGRDGGRYRARWQLHRARHKPDGKLQSQSMALKDLDLDGRELTGATKRETLALIEDKIGLAFDQFRRAVLLAQGEFDAFLRAQPKERGALMERMTGTGIYRDLSCAAHQRERVARDALTRLEDRLGERSVLSTAERARVEAQRGDAEAWQAAFDARRRGVAEEQRWYARDDQLAARVAEAAGLLDEAEEARAAAEDRRQHLATVRALWSLRPIIDAFDEAVRRARLAADRTGRRPRRAPRPSWAADARRQADDAERRLVEARQARRTLPPALQEARRLDEAVATATRAVEGSQAAAQGPSRRQARRRALATAAEARAGHQAAGTPPRPGSTPTQTEKRCRINGIAGIASSSAGRRPAVRTPRTPPTRPPSGRPAGPPRPRSSGPGRRGRGPRRRRRRGGLRGRGPRRQQGLAEAAAHAHRDRVAELGQVLEKLTAVHAAHHAAHGSQAARHAEAKTAHGLAAFADAAAESEEARGKQLKLQVVEARRALELARSVQQLADHRAQLRAGEPCPLCGSTEHPGMHGSDAIVLAQEDRVRHLERDQQKAAGAAVLKRAEAESARRDAQRAVDEAQRLDAQVTQLAEDWRLQAGMSGLALPEVVTDAEVARALAAEAAQHADRRAEADARLATARQLAAGWPAPSRPRRPRAEREASTSVLARAEASAAEAAARLASLVAGRAERATARQALEAELAGPLGAGWSRDAQADPAAFITARAAAVAEFQRERTRRDAAAGRLAALGPEEARLRERVAAQAEETRCRQALADAEAARATARAQRQALLGGRPAGRRGRAGAAVDGAGARRQRRPRDRSAPRAPPRGWPAP
ncbi:MAG: AAA family ATPase [Myxococcales bacterium]|nr:AAA family ATPase [Myxococcales bacterium]